MKTLDEKLDEMEGRMSGIEQTLSEIKKTLAEKSRDVFGSVDGGDDDGDDGGFNGICRSERAKIKNILDNFDFEKVQKVMDVVGWRWAFSKNGIPTVDELKDEAKRILIEAVSEETNISTGGFKVVYERDSDGDGGPYIGLEFILEECEGFDEDEG